MSGLRIAMYVMNDCRTDARVLREAASLAAAGHDVTILARPTDPGDTTGDREERDGFAIVRVPVPQTWRFYWTWVRYPWRMRRWWVGRMGRAARSLPLGLFELLALLAAAAVTSAWAAVRLPFYLRARRRRQRPGGSNLDWVIRWRWVALGWAEAAAAAAPAADVHHGHDLTGLEAAGRARDRVGGELVYDSHEIFLESGSNADRPRWLKRWLGRSEERWARQARALVTVNESLATDLGRRLRPARVVVIHNCPARWDPPADAVDRLRAAAGIAAGTPVALYHGGFSAHRGLEQLADAIRQPGLEAVHAVYLGYGSQRAMLDRLAADPRSGGRVHVLTAVPPEELLGWIATADVDVMPIQPSTLNHRLSTPNKLFESLAAGVPVVVSDFEEMRRIVLDDPAGPLGAACDPTDVAALAAAIQGIVRLAPDARADFRGRCLRAAHERWNWETEVIGLLALYADLAPSARRAVAG
jgi:glycosyltransferase involved in cell wall biosynthesis